MITRFRRWRLNHFKKELSERIPKGIAYLDSVMPDWRDTLRSANDRFDLSSERCLLALLGGTHEDGLAKLEIFSSEAEEYGFELRQRHYKNAMYLRIAHRMWRDALHTYDELQRNVRYLDDELFERELEEQSAPLPGEDELDVLMRKATKAAGRVQTG